MVKSTKLLPYCDAKILIFCKLCNSLRSDHSFCRLMNNDVFFVAGLFLVLLLCKDDKMCRIPDGEFSHQIAMEGELGRIRYAKNGFNCGDI